MKFHLAMVLLGAAALAHGEAVPPVDAVDGILSAYRDHSVVIIGESHGIPQAGAFYIRLIQDPRFQKTVQDIVIEFGSRNNQPLLDRYINGEDVPMDQVRHIWRDTTKVAAWEFPIYAEWLAAIREVNRGLPKDQRLRVLAGDTPVDWSRMHTREDWAKLGENNISFAGVIIGQVLDKKRKALVVLGSNHVTKSGDRDGAPDTTTRVLARYPRSTYVVLFYTGGLGSTFDALFDGVKSPQLYTLAGSPVEKQPYHSSVPVIQNADALLYLGPPKSLVPKLPQPGTFESDYVKEIDRRSMIEWGELRARKFLSLP